MKNLFTIISLCVVFGCSVASAQDLEKIRKRYPGENAVVLEKVMHYQVQVRNGEPYVESKESQKLLYLSDNASQLGRYSFYHGTFHEVREYAAYTQTSMNKKIKVTDFKTSNSSSNNLFYDDLKETRFDFPSAASGATGNLELTTVHTKPYLLSPFYFSRGIPVIKTQLKITCTKDISIKYLLKGLDTSVIRVSKETRSNKTTYVFEVENLPAERSYRDAPDGAWYMPHVVFYIDQYVNAAGQRTPFLGTVDDLYKLNYSFISGVNKVPGPELKLLVDSLTRGTKDKLEHTRRIYRFVQKHIKYIAFEDGMGGFIPRDANLVLHRRYGDCKDMASLLTMMLNTAGVPAYYTWIGTRDIPYTYRETPLPIVDNHMICTAIPGKELIYLDGTDATCVFGSVPSAIQDKEAMIAISSSEYRIEKIRVPSKQENVQVDSAAIELKDGAITGSIHLNTRGYFATNMHAVLSTMRSTDKEKFFKDIFSRGSNKFNLDEYEVIDSNNMNELAVRSKFTLRDYARKIGDEWYINLNLQRFYEHQEIDYPKRKIPIEMDFLFTKKYVTKLKIPDGYEVSYMPEVKSYRNDVWGFAAEYKVENGYLVYTMQFENDHLFLTNDRFQQWNKVLEHLFPLYKESVILAKKP